MLERRFDVQIVCVRVYGSDESLRPPKCRPIMNRTGEAWPVWLATGWDVGADSYRRAKQERRRGEASIGVRTASPPSPGGGRSGAEAGRGGASPGNAYGIASMGAPFDGPGCFHRRKQAPRAHAMPR
ncbi:hypothetical protein BP1258A_1361 [Burkholderia pseudomallei 1258a]|uniref:Uncharacterized protein n=1 Tax=Burkholderia pseudomallei (strain 1026b) TaxID=884204 RepID=A0A0H3HQ76_BURP2|nr:hypothetical protein BP1026B_I1687 [Burkholderia pseudomallei 1026b]EIF65677.1 hypothetical protein BP1258A_1361 [Burkholderia pseudomallei 1258a]EIF66092.1 hypothetical protein BP1026A_0819 [Burkholderia pseudomallei 1026a]EIF67861.1 hypothetical protein BP1258B_1454 [Burkholderia pseudomallei 1258b]